MLSEETIQWDSEWDYKSSALSLIMAFQMFTINIRHTWRLLEQFSFSDESTIKWQSTSKKRPKKITVLEIHDQYET